MKKFIWCSPHQPTDEQLAELESQGTVNYLKDELPEIFEKLTNIQFGDDYRHLVNKLCDELPRKAILVQVPGNAAFHVTLGREVIPGGDLWFAFSKRESVDEKQPDGSVIKRSVFRHIGFDKL